MASVFLTTSCKRTSFNLRAFDNFERILNLSKKDMVKKHHIIDDPCPADLIIFVGDRRTYHSGTFCSEIYKKYSEKVLMLDFNDQTIPRIPGLYSTIPRRLQRYSLYESLFYPYNHGSFDLDKAMADFSGYKYLFSFSGNPHTYPTLRKKILALQHPQGYLQDTSQNFSVDAYSKILVSSKFILCPRGVAASSIRVFEAMRAGRVPVIISDLWKELKCTDNWNDFSVRIAENDVFLIPSILESLEFRAMKMGENARLVWENNFSLEMGFHWIVESCLRIQNSRKKLSSESVEDRNICFETLNKTHFSPFWKEILRSRLSSI